MPKISFREKFKVFDDRKVPILKGPKSKIDYSDEK
jgi:hypothetical protein